MTDTKRPAGADDGEGAPAGKKQKSNEGSPVNYSDSVRKKLQLASRTGQACDRCKERKMRCDPDPSGCGPCKQKQLNCVTTDRITGRASERGQVERLEARIHALEGYLATYEQRYGRLENPDFPTSDNYGGALSSNYLSDATQSQNLSLLAAYTRPQDSNSKSSGPHYGPIRGSKIDIIGAEIDIGSLPSADMEEPSFSSLEESPVYNKSYKSFLYTSTGRQKKPEKPLLPNLQKCREYVDMYFKFVGPYVAVVHRPTLEALFEKYHNDHTFEPTPAQTVIVYMVVATWVYQYGIRNNADEAAEMTRRSNKYFHYAIGFWPELKAGESIEDMEALSLFCVYSRNFPKPGFSWSLCRQVINKAIELDYHRDPSNVTSSGAAKPNFLDLERQKRVFWALLFLNINISIKLARPLPLTLPDMDVDLPLEVDDSDITSDGVASPPSAKCNIRPAIIAYKSAPLLMELYNEVIRLRKPAAQYMATVNKLEYQISLWEQEVGRDNNRLWTGGDWPLIISRLLLESFAAEFRLILHHPTLDTSNSEEFQSQNLDHCHKAAQKLLGNVKQLILQYKGADFTWHMTSVYILAIGVTMHVSRQRKGRLTQESLTAVEQELQAWLMVIGSAGQILNQTNQLHDMIKPKIDQCLGELHNVFIASSALQNGYRQEQQPSLEAQPRPQADPRVSVPFSSADSFQGNYPDPSSTQLGHLDQSHTNPKPTSSTYVEDSQAAAAAVAAANQYAYGFNDRPTPQPQMKYEARPQHPSYTHDGTSYPNSSYPAADPEALISATAPNPQAASNIHPQMMYPNMNLPGGEYGQPNHPASALMSLSRNDQSGVGGLPLDGSVEQPAMWPHGYPNPNGFG